LEQDPVNNQVSSIGDVTSLEEGLQMLWERVRLAGEAVIRLKDERKSLQTHVTALEEQSRKLQAELQKKDEQLRALGAAQQQLQERGTGFLSNGEREAMETRLRDLLSRLEAYL